MQIFTIIILSLSGLLLSMVGLFRLLKPIDTYSKKSGITIPKDVNLLNEVRGVSSLMFCSGILILLGTVLSPFRVFSLLIGALVFIGFGIGRSISIGLDGKPNKLIIQGLVSEFVLGALNFITLIITLK